MGPTATTSEGLLYDVRIYKQKLFSNQVEVLAAPANYTAWINTNYPGLSNKSMGGDPDGDGVNNYDEFAFGLNPSSGSSASPIKTLPNKTTGNFTYTRTNPAVSGMTYKIMTSPDLGQLDGRCRCHRGSKRQRHQWRRPDDVGHAQRSSIDRVGALRPRENPVIRQQHSNGGEPAPRHI